MNEFEGVIVTPEAVVIDLATGGVASRLFGGLVDALVRLAVALVPPLIAAVAGSEALVRIVFAASLFAAIVVYPVVCETWWRGRTVGKLVVGLRVVTATGAPIGLRQAILRSMGGVADLLLPPGGITGLLFVWATDRNQRIGDLLADTIVVRDATSEEPTRATWFPIPPGWEAYAEGIDTTPLTVQQYTMIRAFFLRIHEFEPAGRATLAQELATTTAGWLHRTSSPGEPPEYFLICVLARYQRTRLPARSTTPLPPPGPRWAPSR